MNNLITMRVAPNSRVCDVARAAVDRANRTLDPVAFNVLGVLGIAMPGDSVDGVLDDWSVDFVSVGWRSAGSDPRHPASS